MRKSRLNGSDSMKILDVKGGEFMAVIEYAAAFEGQTPEQYRSAWFDHVRQLMREDGAKRVCRQERRERQKQRIRLLIMCTKR